MKAPSYLHRLATLVGDLIPDLLPKPPGLDLCIPIEATALPLRVVCAVAAPKRLEHLGLRVDWFSCHAGRSILS